MRERKKCDHTEWNILQLILALTIASLSEYRNWIKTFLETSISLSQYVRFVFYVYLATTADEK